MKSGQIINLTSLIAVLHCRALTRRVLVRPYSSSSTWANGWRSVPATTPA